MSLKETLLQDMKASMKEKESGKTKLAVIRMVRSSIRNAEIDGKCELDDIGIGTVIAKEMKQRKESLEDFVKAGRADLAEQVKAEMAVLERYMPRQLSKEEVEAVVRGVIEGMSTADLNMGAVMKAVMPHVQGKADGKVISQTVRELLQNR